MFAVYKSTSHPAIIDALLSGKIGIIPTDTVYGLVALASNEQAVNRLHATKSRSNKPGPIVAANISQLVNMGFTIKELNKARKYWPGAVSVIVQSQDLPYYLHVGIGSVPVRVVENHKIYNLLIITGPLVTTSANITGLPTVSNISEAIKIFGEKVDFYVDGGEIPNNIASTIIKIEANRTTILRPGSAKVK